MGQQNSKEGLVNRIDCDVESHVEQVFDDMSNQSSFAAVHSPLASCTPFLLESLPLTPFHFCLYKSDPLIPPSCLTLSASMASW